MSTINTALWVSMPTHSDHDNLLEHILLKASSSRTADRTAACRTKMLLLESVSVKVQVHVVMNLYAVCKQTIIITIIIVVVFIIITISIITITMLPEHSYVCCGLL